MCSLLRTYAPCLIAEAETRDDEICVGQNRLLAD